MSKASRPYTESLYEDLKDPDEAAEYLTASLGACQGRCRVR